jgi:hypothetical protein
LYNYIKNNYKLPISLLSKDKIIKLRVNLVLNYLSEKKKILSQSNMLFQLSESCVYLFMHEKGKFDIGSQIYFSDIPFLLEGKQKNEDYITEVIELCLHKFTK